MPDFQSLIERVEKASGPDRELDEAIAFIAGWRMRNAIWAAPGEKFSCGSFPPRYTASLDAVMTLKQDGHTFALGDCNEDSVPWACVTSTFGTDYAATGSDVILAALAAILKSRLTERGSHE